MGKWACRHLVVMEQLHYPWEEIKQYYKTYQQLTQVLDWYVDACIKRTKYQEAISILLETKESALKQNNSTAKYSEKLKEIYKILGYEKLYKEELCELVKAGEIEHYQELKSCYTKQEWIRKRETIIPHVSLQNQAKLYEIEELYDPLVSIVLDSEGITLLEKYEKALKNLYPQRLLTKLRQETDAIAKYAGSRKKYRYLVYLLHKMKNYPDGEMVVEELVREWKTKYSNRPAMMDELRQL